MVTSAQSLRRVLGFFEQRLALKEHEGAGRGPWLMMTGHGSTRGILRCYSAPGLDKLVYITLDDGDQLDAAMLMAFGAADSALPHFVLDAARVGRDYAVFVDLVPRVDLAVHPAYVRAVYASLTDVVDGLSRHPQLRASPVPHTLAPYVSPWMAGVRMHASTLPQLFELIAPYASQWLELWRGTLPGVAISPAELVARDLSHRANLFSKEADPVWAALGHTVGDVDAGRVLDLLRKHGVPPSPSVRPPPEP